MKFFCFEVKRVRRPDLRRYVGREMDERAMAAALAMSDEAPAWRALEQVMQGMIDDNVTVVSDPKACLQDGLMKHAAGSIEAVGTLRGRLRDLRERGAGKAEG